MTDSAYPEALPVEHRLHWYVLERVLGQGGFGITYLARDTNLDRRVAIKEYLPVEVAQRRSDARVRERTNAQGERYSWGLERFIAEARTLAHFDHPNIVRVYAVFEENETAYMVMRFEEGENLATLLKRRGTLSEVELLRILLPIFDGLEQVHHTGFIHRDIKPENIHIRLDGSPVLLDFGSARQSLGRIRTMTVLIAPGYAPLEQYYGDAEAQGPWTDIYSLAATCYRAIAGQAPLDAIARTKGVLGSPRDVLVAATVIGHGRYSDRLLRAIDHALELSEKDRPQSIAEWRREIVGDAVAPHSAPRQVDSPRISSNAAALPGHRSPRTAILWAAGGAVLSAVVVGIFLQSRTTPPNFELNHSIFQGAAPPIEPRLEAASPNAPPPVATEKPAPPPTLPVQPSVQSSGKPKSGNPNDGNRMPDFRLATAREPKTETPKAEKPSAPISSGPVLPPMAIVEPPPVTSTPSESGSKIQMQVALDNARSAIERGDYAAALKNLKPLAYGGNARAQLLFGDLLASGKGLPQDYNEAYLWYGLAAHMGNAEAAAKKGEVARKLQGAEIRQADRIIESWHPMAETGVGNQ